MSDTHECPEAHCDVRAATFGSLLSHLANDHGVTDALARYGDADA